MENNDVFTYRRIRRAIGYLGVSLPILLVLLSLVDFFNTRLQPSISHYYYTNLREIFTGILCSTGFFLMRYKGHGNRSILKNDNLLTNIAGIMALGVALFPTSPNHSSEKIYSIVPFDTELLGWLHYGFAMVLFLTFSILAINVFTIRPKAQSDVPSSAVDENNIYKVCGYSIIVFIILIPVSAYFDLFNYSTLVFEALSLFAFGTAWLVKGRALGDKGKIGEKLYRESSAKEPEPSEPVSKEGFLVK
jgi:multisubunit Na+/H+ antiporter MnhB subunit